MLRERLKNAETDPVVREHLKIVRLQAARIDDRMADRADSSRFFDTMIHWQDAVDPADIIARGPSYPWWTRHQHLQIIYHVISAKFKDNKDSPEWEQYASYVVKEMGCFYVDEVSIEYRREAVRMLKAFGLPWPPGV